MGGVGGRVVGDVRIVSSVVVPKTRLASHDLRRPLDAFSELYR